MSDVRYSITPSNSPNMNTKQALEALDSEDGNTRLLAARRLQKLATKTEAPAIRRALALESLSWVKRSLDATLRRVEARRDQSKELTLAARDDLGTSLTSSEAFDIVLHELEPIIGLLIVQAERELPNYESSKTGRQVARLRDALEAIRSLKQATTPAQLGEFELSEWLREQTSESKNLRRIGPSECVVVADKTLLALVLQNGIRNAIEATSSMPATNSEIRVCWGKTRRTAWISIIDQGPGLAETISQPKRPLTSSKNGHPGLGLLISARAIGALGGSVILRPNEPGPGAEFKFEWPSGR